MNPVVQEDVSSLFQPDGLVQLHDVSVRDPEPTGTDISGDRHSSFESNAAPLVLFEGRGGARCGPATREEDVGVLSLGLDHDGNLAVA